MTYQPEQDQPQGLYKSIKAPRLHHKTINNNYF